MKTIVTLLLMWVVVALQAQTIIPLYPHQIPNSLPYAMKEVTMENKGTFLGYRNISQPTLNLYLPDPAKATGVAVIICPGGGYGMESYRLEGTQIAENYMQNGIAAFILKYRLPSDSIMADKSIGPLQDAQQAILTVRNRAKEWGIRPDAIGIMGFSAGGHLASTAGTHFGKSYVPNEANVSLRPDFLVLIYPVISMTEELTHKGSRNNLLGANPTMEQINLFSNELQVSDKTPPTWITHTGDDKAVPVENSIRFYQALVKNNVPAEMHLFPFGNHGFVLKQKTGEWMAPLIKWIGGLSPVPAAAK
ncbi:MAG: alpha/beta hydrolase [Marinilabiliales bacterium]|nr:alpha/beta hydrolase [Marinilabiliales bacterium]